jgi:hypothetical protein
LRYHPKFTITKRLLAQVGEIELMRETIVTSHQCRAPRIRLTSRRPRARPFTLATARALANGRDFPVVVEHSPKEVLDWFAKRLLIERKHGDGGWTHGDILRLHTIIGRHEVMEPRCVGEYRTIAVRAGQFVPPPPNEVPQLMFQLLEWWNTKARELPAVLTSAILHYRVSAIHPFADGNGRVGRALALWELYRNGFDNDRIFSLNGRYWGERRRYYAELRAVDRGQGDLTSWLEFSADALRKTLERLL